MLIVNKGRREGHDEIPGPENWATFHCFFETHYKMATKFVIRRNHCADLFLSLIERGCLRKKQERKYLMCGGKKKKHGRYDGALPAM